MSQTSSILKKSGISGLSHIHSGQVIQRDLNPTNLLMNYTITNGGVTEIQVKIADIGFSISIHEIRDVGQI